MQRMRATGLELQSTTAGYYSIFVLEGVALAMTCQDPDRRKSLSISEGRRMSELLSGEHAGARMLFWLARAWRMIPGFVASHFRHFR